MTTYAELIDKVSRTLQDPDLQTFPEQTVKDMIASAWADLSRVAPRRFQEDIQPVEDTLVYQVLADDFPDPNDDIEVMSVELWDTSTTPNTAFRHVTPQSAHPTGLSYSQAGWRFWGGMIYLPNRVVDLIDVTNHLIRLWGYSPWPVLVADDDVVPFGQVHEEALVIRSWMEALRRLINNRSLFTQWQTRSNNTDVTPAALMNELNLAREEWRQLARSIQVLREAP